MNTNNNEEGFILVITMLILVILTLVGLAAVRTGKVEIQIAGNEKWAEASFFRADSATEISAAVTTESSSQKTKMRSNLHKYGNVYIPGSNLDMILKDKDGVSNLDSIDFDTTFTENDPYIIFPLNHMQGGKLAQLPITLAQVGKEYKQHGQKKGDTANAWADVSIGSKNESSSKRPVFYNYWTKDMGDMRSESKLQEQYRDLY